MPTNETEIRDGARLRLGWLSCIMLFMASGCRSVAAPEVPTIRSRSGTSLETETVSQNSAKATANATPTDLVVTVERIPNAGLFASAATRVLVDGTVVFTGYKNVKSHGAIGPEAVTQIWHAIQSAEFFTLDDEYIMRASDCPLTVITVQANGIRKQVRNRWVGGRSYVVYPDGVDIEKHETLDALASRIEMLGETTQLITRPRRK